MSDMNTDFAPCNALRVRGATHMGSFTQRHAIRVTGATHLRGFTQRHAIRVTGATHLRGFTLMEIMVVVVILGILAALVAPNVFRRVDDARVTKAKQDIRGFETALNLYRMDNYKVPTNDQGLQALVTKPADSTVRNWKEGGYINGLRKDPWGNDYKYQNPGSHGEFDIFTYGADGEEGGEGPNADIGNWNLD